MRRVRFEGGVRGMFNEMIREVCAERNIRCETLSFGWLLSLTRDGKVRHIAGHHFDGNAAAADRIACDKHACYTVLTHNGIPAAVHEIIFDPVSRAGWMGEGGAWRRALTLFHAFGHKVVVKPNAGWQGRDVCLCKTPAEMERALSAVFQREPNACVCPFYKIKNEYRVFYVYGDCPLAYGKALAPGLWKHNLSGGALAFDVSDGMLLADLYSLAKKAAECVNISFATVDIIQLADDSLLVMEINAGVTAKRLLEQLPGHREKVKRIYERAVEGMFA
jgi:glutathione synthase/RimK-type ligase-like ATP-grasp enzyme